MFCVKFDDARRKIFSEKGIIYKPLASVYQDTPEFENYIALVDINPDPLYQWITEDDGKTHTFFRIILPEPAKETA